MFILLFKILFKILLFCTFLLFKILLFIAAVLNSSAVQDSDIQASVDLDYELPEFLVLKEKLVDAQEPRETVNLSFLSVKPSL